MKKEQKKLKMTDQTQAFNREVQRLLSGKENNNKFGRYLHEFTIEHALQQLA